MKKQIYIVDAYNVIGCWPFLARLKLHNRLPAARDRLLKILSDFQDFNKLNMIVVFDAMYVPTPEQKIDYHNLNVIWTQRDETADSYIEAYVRKHHSILKQFIVVTSDNAEQWTVFEEGALRMPDSELLKEIKYSDYDIKQEVHHYQDQEQVRKVPWDKKQINALTKLRNNLEHKSK